MKFLRQMCIIVLFSFLGELCRAVIPFPIPASIYGMVLMLGALFLKIIKVDQVKDAGNFLVSFFPVLFIAPTVNLIACWDYIKNDLLALVAIIILTTLVTFGVSGMVTQWVSRRKGGRSHD